MSENDPRWVFAYAAVFIVAIPGAWIIITTMFERL